MDFITMTEIGAGSVGFMLLIWFSRLVVRDVLVARRVAKLKKHYLRYILDGWSVPSTGKQPVWARAIANYRYYFARTEDELPKSPASGLPSGFCVPGVTKPAAPAPSPAVVAKTIEAKELSAKELVQMYDEINAKIASQRAQLRSALSCAHADLMALSAQLAADNLKKAAEKADKASCCILGGATGGNGSLPTGTAGGGGGAGGAGGVTSTTFNPMKVTSVIYEDCSENSRLCQLRLFEGISVGAARRNCLRSLQDPSEPVVVEDSCTVQPISDHFRGLDRQFGEELVCFRTDRAEVLMGVMSTRTAKLLKAGDEVIVRAEATGLKHGTVYANVLSTVIHPGAEWKEKYRES